jgi:hypothetical protein
MNRRMFLRNIAGFAITGPAAAAIADRSPTIHVDSCTVDLHSFSALIVVCPAPLSDVERARLRDEWEAITKRPGKIEVLSRAVVIKFDDSQVEAI